MSAIRVQATVTHDGTLVIKCLPSMAGHTVDVLVQDRISKESEERYPLRGKPIQYENPFEAVAEGGWDSLR